MPSRGSLYTDQQPGGHAIKKTVMSEYHYYEFLALDRPLTADEMQQLRAFPTVDRTR